MKLYHPDKGHGDTKKFIQVHEAMLALTDWALGAEDYGARQMLVAPQQDKTYEDMTVGDLEHLARQYNGYWITLESAQRQLEIAVADIQEVLKKNASKATEQGRLR